MACEFCLPCPKSVAVDIRNCGVIECARWPKYDTPTESISDWLRHSCAKAAFCFRLFANLQQVHTVYVTIALLFIAAVRCVICVVQWRDWITLGCLLWCRFAKFDSEKMKSKQSFLTTLRSTGQQKYTVEDKDSIAVRRLWLRQYFTEIFLSMI